MPDSVKKDSVKKDSVKFEGMGHALPQVVPYVPGDNCKVIYEPKVVIDKETLQPVVEVSDRDLDKEIQSCKDECGIAYILRQVAAGRLSVDSIRDDGKHGFDAVGLPQSMNEASMVNTAMQSEAKAAAGKIGLSDLTEEGLQKLIQAEIAKAKAAADSAKSSDGGK